MSASSHTRFRKPSPLVLVVDDFVDGREMYASFLSFAGFRVAQAANGAEALDVARRCPPAVVLLDLAMPVLDGWQTLTEMRADPDLKHVPAIMVTGHLLRSEEERALSAGFDAFVAKPCLPERLVEVIRQVLARATSATA